MAFAYDRIIVHLDTNKLTAYHYTDGIVTTFLENDISLNNDSVKNSEFEMIDAFFEMVKKEATTVDTTNIKVYATGILGLLDFEDRNSLINHIFIFHGLYTAIISPDLEQFYRESGSDVLEHPNIIKGLIKQEFRSVVVCGSFKHSIKEIEKLINKLHDHGIKVLSPTTTKLRSETLGTAFVLFEGQELMNERDAWGHQFWHISQFAKADAVIICNPGGVVGKGAFFELGYLSALTQRLIFQEEPADLSVRFPYEVGLNF